MFAHGLRFSCTACIPPGCAGQETTPSRIRAAWPSAVKTTCYTAAMRMLLDALVQLLGALSVMAGIAAGAVGGLLLLLGLFGGSGGFILSSIGILDGLVVLAAGNLVCLVFNLAILTLRRWHDDIDWLRNLVVRVQLVPAIVSVVGALLYFGIAWRNETAERHAQSIEPGLAQGSAEAVAAFEQCTGNCQSRLIADRQLLLAAQYDRMDWAVMARRRGGRATSIHYYSNQRADPVHCENDVTVSYANALELAVIHDDSALIDLILPLTDTPFKEQALYTAVVLGRQDATRQLLDAFGWTELPQGLERLSRRADGTPALVVPPGPLRCELPSWSALGYAPQGR